jgi:cytochrome c
MRTLTIAACTGAMMIAAAAARAQDAKHGAQVFATYCAMCHSTLAGRNVMGPSLNGVVGRKAGTMAGFNYSPAMQTSGVVWSEASLDSYLAAPKTFVPKNRMSFPGLPAARDRADLIAFLATQK